MRMASNFICPKCGGEKNTVVDTRAIDAGIRRRRECTVCKFRWNTVEILETREDKVENNFPELCKYAAASLGKTIEFLNQAKDRLEREAKSNGN